MNKQRTKGWVYVDRRAVSAEVLSGPPPGWVQLSYIPPGWWLAVDHVVEASTHEVGPSTIIYDATSYKAIDRKGA